MTGPLPIDVVRDFIQTVVRCLRTTVGVHAVVAAAAAAGHRQARPTIAVTLDFAGDIRGPVTWVFPPTIALELVRRLTADPHPDPSSATDGATELANILTGRATEVLETHGFRCEISTPRVHVGALPAGVRVQMTTADGPIEVVLSLSDVELPAA
jgi:CheY-specific phosphatase CheX